ncbi:MAG: 4Fe-4S binding protein [Bacillota bacterium]|nr:4Fe-4S binding protein [Bacillota bacterium]
MKTFLSRIRHHRRITTQVLFTALTNGYVKGFAEGSIYKGSSKALCVPGLNCYSCPGAFGSCPIGAMQATLGSQRYQFAFYITGFLMVIGAALGRFVCGWLCPFGLIQDLLHKIPFLRKLRKLPGDGLLRFLKYIMLGLLVILLPMVVVDMVGQGKPWFCEYVCPSGTLMAGIPLVASNEGLRAVVGWLFTWKVLILAVIVILSIVVYRPFCRYICPLGAVYGLFNPIALYRYSVDEEKCISCGKCQKACGFDIKTYETPNSPECIRCGKCKTACPANAICSGFTGFRTGAANHRCPDADETILKENINQ